MKNLGEKTDLIVRDDILTEKSVPKKDTMYAENKYFPDAFKGCKHKCIYCVPSFQRQAKRQKQNCEKCYTFEPHAHLERLNRKAPKTTGKQFVFFPKGGDLAFAHPSHILEMLKFVENNPQTTFLFGQTKDPRYLTNYRYPQNAILAITLETNKTEFDTPSEIKNYTEISLAPNPFMRFVDFARVNHNRKAIIIEPILQFDLNELVKMVQFVKPEFVYIGYDTKNCRLPEPTLTEVRNLKGKLSTFTEVRMKTWRSPWWD